MEKIFGTNLEFTREDDYIEYYVFPKLNEINGSDERDSEQQLRSQLDDVKGRCMKLIENLIKERQYIWHKDEFKLCIRTCTSQEMLLNDDSEAEGKATNGKNQQEDSLPPHLYGVTHYGDNISDEWFIVYLLKQITKEFADIIVRVVDSDGEFLLIEAADVLPKWANPDTCEQRVYLANGCMHLVQNSPSNTAKPMTVATAVAKIQNNSALYKVSKEIQDCIDEVLKEFESSMNNNLHHQIVRLPLGVAMILKKQPSLIAPAVRAFCERDAVDMKACRSMRYFPPEQRIRTNVCFTRCLYAMIMHSNYVPDLKIGWNLSGNPTSEEYKEDLLGIKLACGFEILTSQAKDAQDEENSVAWKVYVKSLQAKGYFKENIEGSADYQRLLEQAKSYFKDNQTRFRTRPLVGKEILYLLKTTEINADELRDEENNLMPSDSDDWLNISPEQLDAMLTERYGPKKLYKANGDINAEEFTKNIAEFLEKESTFEGVERDSDDDSSDEETPRTSAGRFAKRADLKTKIRKNNSMRKACRTNPVNVNQSINTSDADESFTTQVKSFLDFVIPEDKWDSNSEMSDYEDEEDIERNFAAMADAGKHIDADIKAYMDQMDRELAKTTVGQSFSNAGNKKPKSKSSNAAHDDDFDDIEDFEPININVNTLKNMMDSYKSQIGGTGPVSNLLSAMGAGMSTAGSTDETEDLKESAV